MEPRLATSIFVGALIRRAESEGGFGAVLAKGDQTAGAIIVILNENGRKQRILERVLQPDGRYLWQDNLSQSFDNEQELTAVLQRRRGHDPDLWLIELDIVSAERFAAEMNSAS